MIVLTGVNDTLQVVLDGTVAINQNQQLSARVDYTI